MGGVPWSPTSRWRAVRRTPPPPRAPPAAPRGAGTERAEVPLVHDQEVRGRDHVAQAPGELPAVPHEELFPRGGRVAPVPGPEAGETDPRGRVDRDDLEALPERLPERLELRGPAEAVNQDMLPDDAGQGPLRPHAVPVGLPLPGRAAADCLARGPEHPAGGLPPHRG